MRYVNLITRRVAHMVPVILGLTFVVFFLIHLVPGNPALTMLGVHATPQAVRHLDIQFGLNTPVVTQYLSYLGRLLHGNLGTSLFYDSSVAGLISRSLGTTLFLLLYAAILAVLIAVPLATIAATHKDRALDHVVRVVPMLGLAMPSIWLGIILILLFGVDLHIFPVGGYGSGFLGHLYYMLLPALTVALALSPILVRSLRASMIDTLDADFVSTARAKGLPEITVLRRHVLRNALIPAVTILGTNLGWLISSAVVVERVFGIPGLGSLMIDSIVDRDFPVVQGVALIFGLLVVVINLLCDISYFALDPRVKA